MKWNYYLSSRFQPISLMRGCTLIEFRFVFKFALNLVKYFLVHTELNNIVCSDWVILEINRRWGLHWQDRKFKHKWRVVVYYPNSSQNYDLNKTLGQLVKVDTDTYLIPLIIWHNELLFAVKVFYITMIFLNIVLKSSVMQENGKYWKNMFWEEFDLEHSIFLTMQVSERDL